MSLWSFQGARGLDVVVQAHLDPPAEITAETASQAGHTDLSKLNSALAARPTEVERSACFDEVNVI
jgi:hypothetical protein